MKHEIPELTGSSFEEDWVRLEAFEDYIYSIESEEEFDKMWEVYFTLRDELYDHEDEGHYDN